MDCHDGVFARQRFGLVVAALAAAASAACGTVLGIEDTSVLDAAEPEVLSIAELRDRPNGPIDVVVEDAIVSYVGVGNTNQFFIQRGATGPAITVFTADAIPDVEVGNRIDLRVTELATFSGNRQIVAFEVVANDGGAFDVQANLAQTLSLGAGIPPSPALEGELVTVRGAVIVGIVGAAFEIEYGNAPTRAVLFAPETDAEGSLCPGAGFDVTAVVTLFLGEPQIRAFNSGDFTFQGAPCP